MLSGDGQTRRDPAIQQGFARSHSQDRVEYRIAAIGRARWQEPQMPLAPLPQYVLNLARWFEHEVPDLRTGVRVGARRPFCKMDELDEALLVRSGLIAITAAGGSRRQIIALRYPNELILPFQGSRNVSVEAVTETTLSTATMSAFDSALPAKPKTLWDLAQVLGRERAIACEWIARAGLQDSAGRLAHVVCETFLRLGIDANADTLTLPFSQQHLAELTGQTTVNVNRMLMQLEGGGLISRDRRNLVVKDWLELSRLGGFDAVYLQ